jgi:hypothetical protein
MPGPDDLFVTKSLLGTPPDFKLPLTGDAGAGQNGRITFNESAIADPYAGLPGFNPQVTVEPDFQADMLRGNWESTPVSNGFFSSANVDRIQQLIRKGVYDRSGSKQYVIDSQSADELKIIMRAIYYQYGRNMTTDILGQVDDLNKKVVDWSVPHILSAVDMYHYYLKDISKLPVPLEQPQHLSRAGTRSLPMNPFM